MVNQPITRRKQKAKENNSVVLDNETMITTAFYNKNLNELEMDEIISLLTNTLSKLPTIAENNHTYTWVEADVSYWSEVSTENVIEKRYI